MGQRFGTVASCAPAESQMADAPESVLPPSKGRMFRLLNSIDERGTRREFLSLVLLRLPLARLARYAVRVFLYPIRAMDPNDFLKPSLERPATSLADPYFLEARFWTLAESPVECVCFGWENIFRAYILLAIGLTNGRIIVYPWLSILSRWPSAGRQTLVFSCFFPPPLGSGSLTFRKTGFTAAYRREKKRLL